MSANERLDRLTAVSELFQLGRFYAVVTALEAESDEGGEIGRAMLLAARAIILEKDGQPTEAAQLMEEALGLVVPLPHVLERMADFFRRNDRPLLAHYAFLMADVFSPMALNRFAARQEGLEKGRYAPWTLRASPLARDRDLYGMAVHKSALEDRLGPDEAAMVLASITGPAGSHVARERPVQRLIDHAAEHGLDFQEVMPARPVQSRPPLIYGQVRAAPIEKVIRPFFTCVLEDVVVTGKSDILLTADVALLDVAELRPGLPVFHVDPTLAAGGNDSVFVAEPAAPDQVRHVPEGLWLSGKDSRAFGHWIVEFMPRIWAFMDRPGFAAVPIIIDTGMPPQHEEALRFFIGAGHPIITLGDDEHVRVDRLWVASKLRNATAMDGPGFVRLLERARPALEAVETSDTPERIVLTRKPTQHRRLTNAEVVEAELVRRGYRVYDFAEVPFAEQVRLIRGARHVVGPDGSAFMMTLLGKPGLRIGGFTQPFTEEIEDYTDLCDALGQDLTVLVGKLEALHPRFRWMSDYSIDLAELAAYLDSVDG